MLTFIRTHAFLFIIPVIGTLLSLLSRGAVGSFWQHADPCYMFLFNALHMIKGITPTFLDNPGTPLQILLLWVIKLLNLGHSAAETLDKVLLNPEFYLNAVHLVLMLGSFLSSVMLAAYLYHKTQNKIASLLTQLPALSFFSLRVLDVPIPVISVLSTVGAEHLLVIIINLFNLFFLRLFFTKTPREEFIASIGLGLTCGLGFATKLTFIPLVCAGFLIIPWKKKFHFLTGFAVAFVLGTLPVLSKYPVLFKSIFDYASHTSSYGSGPKGFVNWPDFWVHAKMILVHYWFFVCLSLGVLFWSALKLIRNRNNRSALFLMIAAFGSLLQYLATAKHFSFHYLLPGLGLFSIIFALLYLQWMPIKKLYQTMAMIFILLFVSLTIIGQLFIQPQISAFHHDLIKVYHDVSLKYPHAIIIPASTIGSGIYLTQAHGLFLGNYGSLHKEDDELAHLYPHTYYFDTERSETRDREDGYGIRDFRGQRIFADDLLASRSPVIFIKLGSQFFEPALNVRLIESSKYASAWLLVGSTEKQAYELFLQSQHFLEKGQYQQAFAYALKSRSLNFEPQGKIDYFLSLIYPHLSHE